MHRFWMICGLLAVVGFVEDFSTKSHATQFMAGVDISALPSLEQGGAVYSVDGVPGDAVKIFAQNAANWARLRLFVDPSGFNVQDQDLAYTIALAQRVKASGMKVLLDFHYSDTWADPGNQTKPAAWASLSFRELEQQVYDYTKDVIASFDAAGVLPEMVQIGNEIPSGMLWNDGRLWRPGIPEGDQFDDLAALLSAGINGARDAAPGQEPLIMIHHDRGDRWSSTSYYFDRLLPRLQANDTDIDVIGYSWYPLWHSDSITSVQQNLNNTAAAYNKPVVIVETGFAYSCPECEPDYPYDVSAEGQQEFLQDVVDAVLAVPDDMGWGVFWWFAEGIPHVGGLNIWQNGRYGLFDESGELLPAMDAFVKLPRLPGDVDDDGDTDLDDFTIIQNNLNSDVFPVGVFPRHNGDLNLDGIVDLEDFGQWKDNYAFPGTGSVEGWKAVPEPASFAILLSLTGLFHRTRRPMAIGSRAKIGGPTAGAGQRKSTIAGGPEFELMNEGTMATDC